MTRADRPHSHRPCAGDPGHSRGHVERRDSVTDPLVSEEEGMSDNRIGELYAAVAEWVLSKGARDLSKSPGVWHGKTEERAGLGPLDVRINPHEEKIDHIPPFNIRIGMDDYFPGIIALIGPFGGTILASPRPGEDEVGLIEHFKAQTLPIPATEGSGATK